ERDLGVTVSGNGKSAAHVRKIVGRAYQVSHLIFNGFVNRDPKFLGRLFAVYIRPILEYASVVWSPHLIGDIDAIERVQRRFTKRIPSIATLPYSQRLAACNLEILELRRIRFDLVQLFKMVCLGGNAYNNLITLSTLPTRGHPWKIFVERCSSSFKQHAFPYRSFGVRNALDSSCFAPLNLNSF